MHQATCSLAEQGTREDAPTGKTPRKRVWQYVDQWELTKDREAVLRAWREQGVSGVGNETVLPDHLPRPGHEEMMDDVETPKPEIPTDSPLAVSTSSSASIPMAQSKKMGSSLKSGSHTLGTLTDRPTNIPMGQGFRRGR
jgi:kinesin family protein 11